MQGKQDKQALITALISRQGPDSSLIHHASKVEKMCAFQIHVFLEQRIANSIPKSIPLSTLLDQSQGLANNPASYRIRRSGLLEVTPFK